MARRLLSLTLVCVLAPACLPQVGGLLDAGGPAPGTDGGLGVACAGPGECASGVCTSGHCAAPFDPCAPGFAGCGSATDYVDATLSTGAVVVAFPAGGETSYSPKCLRVHLGQDVTFRGSFDSHPLDQACGPLAGGIPSVGGGSSTVISFDVALGTYGYYCQNHGSPSGGGMAGAIQVVK